MTSHWHIPDGGYIIPPFRVTILYDHTSWLAEFIPELAGDLREEGMEVTTCVSPDDLPGGDICFLLSWHHILPKESLGKYWRCLVVHESALPKGRGWSPLTWQVLEGSGSIDVCLVEAAERVDIGKIYARTMLKFTGSELVDELRAKQWHATLILCYQTATALQHNPSLRGEDQAGEPTTHHRRTPKDSRLDPHKTIAEQFNLLRVVDNERYPAFFHHLGHVYELKIRKLA